jgi:hypothetical protein
MPRRHKAGGGQEELDSCLNCGGQCQLLLHQKAFATEPISWPSAGSL